MKKILYTLFAVSLLAVGCTKDVAVSRDHDIDAEVTDMQTKMEMKTLYCNLNESASVDLQKLSEYLTENDADVVMFVSPVSVNGTNFMTWLNAYAAEQGGLIVLESVNDVASPLTMAALVKDVWSCETYTVKMGATLENPLLHFKANGIHFVVTELNAAKNAIPNDWVAQVEAMTANKKKADLVYEPDFLAKRKTELSYIIKQTVDNKAFIKDVNWVMAMNMNAASHLDIVKYDKEFLREEYYNEPVDPADGYFDWYEFINTETSYFSVAELLASNDIYFNVSQLMAYYNLIDCNAVHHSVYTPSSDEGDEDGVRNNFLYATDEGWNMFQSFDFDTVAASELGVTHYPMIVTLKSEE